jgi:hypothetical protein
MILSLCVAPFARSLQNKVARISSYSSCGITLQLRLYSCRVYSTAFLDVPSRVFETGTSQNLDTGGWLALPDKDLFAVFIFFLSANSLYKKCRACLGARQRRTAGYPTAPPQIPACRFPAPGSSPTLAFVITPDSPRNSFEYHRLSIGGIFCI